MTKISPSGEKVVNPPDTSDEAWAPAIKIANSVNRDEKLVTACQMPDVLEMTHHMMGMEDALMALYEEPECMHGLIERVADYEILM